MGEDLDFRTPGMLDGPLGAFLTALGCSFVAGEHTTRELSPYKVSISFREGPRDRHGLKPRSIIMAVDVEGEPSAFCMLQAGVASIEEHPDRTQYHVFVRHCDFSDKALSDHRDIVTDADICIGEAAIEEKRHMLSILLGKLSACLKPADVNQQPAALDVLEPSPM